MKEEWGKEDVLELDSKEENKVIVEDKKDKKAKNIEIRKEEEKLTLENGIKKLDDLYMINSLLTNKALTALSSEGTYKINTKSKDLFAHKETSKEYKIKDLLQNSENFISSEIK
mmetsp:Transcript_40808/g.46786  ORF Transcript_40808/g.46786 Transcript_40808/m.46786 type:complete len:114 (+) Transcript_40808:145-486(+)